MQDGGNQQFEDTVVFPLSLKSVKKYKNKGLTINGGDNSMTYIVIR